MARLGILFAAASIAALATPTSAQTVAIPMITALAIGAAFTIILFARSRVAPIAEIGFWFTAAVVVYTVLPLAVFLAIGQQYTPFNDNRLMAMQPGPAEVASAAWLYVTFLAAFAFVYLAVRGRAEPPRGDYGHVSAQTKFVLIALWLALILVGSFFSPTSAGDGSYGSGALAIQALPLWLRQLVKILASWSVVITIAVRVWLFQNYNRTKWLIAAWVVYDVVVTAMRAGTRTGAVLSLASVVLLYHLMVKPIKLRTALVAGIIALAGFLALGFVRSLQGVGAGGFNASAVGGEFESLFANAVDLQRRVASGEIGHLPWTFHLADVFAAIPSQLVPFTKLDPGDWYVNTFYPETAARGGGLAFGVIAQSIVGLGLLELVVRGAIIGAAFAGLHRFFASRTRQFWVVVLYVWTTVWAYQSFRNQSFTVFSAMIEEFLPLLLAMQLTRLVVFHAGKRSAPVEAAAPGIATVTMRPLGS